MKKTKITLISYLIIIVALLLTFFSSAIIKKSPKSEQKTISKYIEGRIIVKFKKDVPYKQIKKRIVNDIKSLNSRGKVIKIRDSKDIFRKGLLEKKSFGFRDGRKPKGFKAPELSNIYVVDYDKCINVEDLRDIFLRDQDIIYAEPDYILNLYMVPNDPYYYSSGSWGQDYDDMWAIKKIDCEKAWDMSTGENVTVAVIDTGVDYNHEDLSENIWINEYEIPDNGIDDDNNGYIDDIYGYDFSHNWKTGTDESNNPMDNNGHGTHCAGTIAAKGNNNKGVIGVAHDSKIMGLKVFGYTGLTEVSRCVRAIHYAVENGADVISCSWGGMGKSLVLADVFKYAFSEGGICIAAAGNDNLDIAENYDPACINEVISVASSDPNDIRSYFSNYGLKIDVTAPGGGYGADESQVTRNILSLRSLNNGNPTDMYAIQDSSLSDVHIVGENYYRARGTSMACPHVAGLAALILSYYPDIAIEEVYARIIGNTDNIYDINPDFINLLGSGRINAFKALSNEPLPFIRVIDQKVESGIYDNTYNIIINLQNRGGYAQNVTATLTSTNSNIESIISDTSYFGDIYTWSIGDNSTNPFSITISENCPIGTEIKLFVNIKSDNDFEADFNLSIISGIKIKVLEYGESTMPPIIEDLDSDNMKEIIVPINKISGQPVARICVLNHDLTLKSENWPINIKEGDYDKHVTLNGIAVGDIDGNGTKEIVFTVSCVEGKILYGQDVKCYTELYAYDCKGNLLNNFPVSYCYSGTGALIYEFGEVCLADINGDDLKDIVVLESAYETLGAEE